MTKKNVESQIDLVKKYHYPNSWVIDFDSFRKGNPDSTLTINDLYPDGLYQEINPLVKENKNDKTWWVRWADGRVGEMVFTFDKKKFYTLYWDYPNNNLSKEEKEIFDKENPFWKDFFKDRSK